MAGLSVGVREFKGRLSEYLRQVKEGKTIVITEHGKPVGRLIPTRLSVEERIDAMCQAGLVQWSGKKPSHLRPLAKLRGPKSMAQLISEDRE